MVASQISTLSNDWLFSDVKAKLDEKLKKGHFGFIAKRKNFYENLALNLEQKNLNIKQTVS